MTAATLGISKPFGSMQLSTGALVLMKWLALFSMVVDHMNRAIFNSKYPLMLDIGRLAFPIFGFVLAYNLARPGALAKGVYRRVISRLLIAGALATPFYFLAVGSVYPLWPLNIMFTLAVFACAVWIFETDAGTRFYVVPLVIIAGSFVDYFWFGLAYCLAAWWFCKHPAWPTLAAWFLGTACVFFVNDYNPWTFAALPLIGASAYVRLDVPKFKSLFYFIYPAHLGLLAAWNARHFL